MSTSAHLSWNEGVADSGIAATLPGVEPLERMSRALRAVREASGYDQSEAARRAGLAPSVLNRAETGKSYLSLRSLLAVLEATGTTFHDFAAALDSIAGEAPPPSRGRARPPWVHALRQRGIDSDVLFGMAYGGIEPGDAAAEADLVASAEAAARELAVEILDQRRAAEDLPAVAEPTPPYSASPTLRSTSPTSGRGRRGGG